MRKLYLNTKFLLSAFGSIIISLIVICLSINLEAKQINQIHKPALTAPLSARAGTRRVTPDWLLSVPDLQNDRPSIHWLDNTYLIYSFPPNEAKQPWKIEILNTCTGDRKFLADGIGPKASPDGQWIAFSRGKGQENQLWIISNNGTGLKQLTHIEGGLGIYGYSYSFDWSPDSKQIALAHQLYIEYWKDKDKPESHIDVIDIMTGQTKRIASLKAYIDTISWFPNGEELLFMKMRLGCEYNTEEDHTWIESVNINNGQVHTIMHFDGLQQILQPTVSPDGRFVAFMYDADNPIFNFMLSIGVVSTDLISNDTLPSIFRLTEEMSLSKPKWSQDSQSIYALRKFGAYSKIYVFDIKTKEARQVTNAPLGMIDYTLSPDNTRLVWIGLDLQGTYSLSIANCNGDNVRNLIEIPTASEDMAFSEIREIEWEVPNYPMAMRGLLFLPLNYQEGIRHPLVVDIHGGGSGASIGPEGGILVSTLFEWHMWTAKGYAVFVPEFRSSASFGSLAITRNLFQEHDDLNCDIMDINAGVDALIACGIVDSNRLAVIGHSAGGRRANWLTVATHRYHAVISKEGWADSWIEYLTMKTRSKGAELMFGGAPWEVPQNYLKNSALYHAAGATTPTLFLMGNPKIGGADPANTVRMLYNALKGQGVETEYIEYPDEGHVFEKPENRRDVLLRSIKWIDEHIGENCNLGQSFS